MADESILVQRSPEWLLAVCGSLGASRVGSAIAKLKTGARAKSSEDMMYEIAAERLTRRARGWENAAKWGAEHEPEARAAYSFLTNESVREIGLIPHPTIANAHASPDGLVGDDGGVELKCPTSATHLRTLVAGAVPEDHLPQLHWSMACSGRRWWDFVSFDPRFPGDLQMFVRRVQRDDAIIARMEADVRSFLADVEAVLTAVDDRGAP